MQELQPFLFWGLGLGGDYLHLVPALEDIGQWHKPHVHLRRNGRVADMRMDAVCKVQCRRAFLNPFLLTFRGEYEDVRSVQVVVDYV